MYSRSGFLYAGAALLIAVVLATLVLFGDQRTWLLAANTAALAAGACALALPLGTVLALLLLRTDLPARRLWLIAFATLLLVPLYLHAAGWDAGFGRQGWFSLAYGSIAEPLLDRWRAAIWIHGLAAIPWVLLIVGIGLRLVEPELEEAALLDGRPTSVVWRITLRTALPFVVVAALWVLVLTGTEMTITDLYRVRTFAEEIYIDVPFVGAVNGMDPMRPTALTNVILISALVCAALLATTRLAPPEHVPSVRRRHVFSLGVARWPAFAMVAAVVVVVAGIPLGNLAYKAGVVVEQVGPDRVRQWSPAMFAEVVFTSPARFAEEHGWTALIAGLAATGAVVIGTPLAWLARRGGWRSVPAIVVAALCLAVPGPLIGLSIIWLLNRETPHGLIWLYDRTIFAPWLALLVKCLPIVVLISWYALRTIPTEVLDSAATEGAGGWTRFWRIGVWQRRISLGVAWHAAFAVAMGDLAASILVVPPGVTTVSVRVFGLLHAGADDQVAGICLTTVWLFVLESIVILCLVGRQNRRSE